MSFMDFCILNNLWSIFIIICVVEAMERVRKDYEIDLEILGLISMVSGFFGRVLSVFGEIVGEFVGGGIFFLGMVFFVFGDWVVVERSVIIEDIEVQWEVDQELVWILCCELFY